MASGKSSMATTNTMLFPGISISCAPSDSASIGSGANVLVRRSQRAKKKWESLTPVFEQVDTHTPESCIPILVARFHAIHPS